MYEMKQLIVNGKGFGMKRCILRQYLSTRCNE